MASAADEESLSIDWQLADVASPHLDKPVSVYIAKHLPYEPNANRFQNVSVYAPKSATGSLPFKNTRSPLSGDGLKGPRWHVHIHGGAWRDPNLDSSSIEATVAHAFHPDSKSPIEAIVSINYTLSPFPTHPSLPYDFSEGDDADPARNARHPDHVRDVLRAFMFLRRLGLQDDSYILSGHSAGACLAFQSTLFEPRHWGPSFEHFLGPPRPAAIVGLNGLYDLPGLVHDPSPSHEHLQKVYENLQTIAFGADQAQWAEASPARVDVRRLAGRVREGTFPRLIILDQSTEDQLVPMNQIDKLEEMLKQVESIRVIRGRRCQGKHAAPWEEGYMIWNTILDTLALHESIDLWNVL